MGFHHVHFVFRLSMISYVFCVDPASIRPVPSSSFLSFAVELCQCLCLGAYLRWLPSPGALVSMPFAVCSFSTSLSSLAVLSLLAFAVLFLFLGPAGPAPMMTVLLLAASLVYSLLPRSLRTRGHPAKPFRGLWHLIWFRLRLPLILIVVAGLCVVRRRR